VAAAGGSGSIGLGHQIIADNDATFINVGALISAIITFLITAAVVYFVFVLPMNKAREISKARRGEEEAAEPVPDDVLLLTEIRDLLKSQEAAGNTPRA
jgi:large conductance mechanosensitive channel